MAEDRFRGEGEEDGKRRGKKKALWGRRHPQGPDRYSFLVTPQEKLKAAERKILFCKNKINVTRTRRVLCEHVKLFL